MAPWGPRVFCVLPGDTVRPGEIVQPIPGGPTFQRMSEQMASFGAIQYYQELT
jgi:hypothetical protein